MSEATIERKVQRCGEVTEALRARIAERIIGHEEIVDLILTSFFAGGHALLEGVPGIGKTMLVRTLADAVDASFSRIQFTPDLMPADVTGTTILSYGADGGREFRFRPGPLFAQVVLADEVNRATPKTQAAMLEAMGERQVTSDGQSRPLPDPFMVLATQNPLDMEGTYPLPEAQLDRFLYKILARLPSHDELVKIIDLKAGGEQEAGEPVTTAAEIESLIKLARDVVLTHEIQSLIAKLVRATHAENPEAPERVKRYVRHGASPRAALALAMGLKARALMEGRPHGERKDLKLLIKPAFRHRIALNFEGEAEGLTPDDILDDVLESVSLR